MNPPASSTRLAVLGLLGLCLPAGCGQDPAPEPDSGAAAETPSAEAPAEPTPARSWERALVLLASEGDSTWAVPWIFTAERREDRERRSWGIWLARAGGWEELVREEATGPIAGSGWRLVPGPSVRLVMGEADALERVLLRNPSRQVQLTPGDLLSEWAGPEGERVVFRRGRVTLPGDEVEGFLLDLAPAARPADRAPGDWVFLQGGDEFQAVLLESLPVADPRSPGRFRAWTRVAVREAVWPEVSLEWDEVRPFERARRDVPVRWTISAPGQEMVGELEAVGSHLAAGEAEGPLLPVDAFFQVEGEIEIEGETFQVTGVIHHRQR